MPLLVEGREDRLPGYIVTMSEISDSGVLAPGSWGGRSRWGVHAVTDEIIAAVRSSHG